MPDRLPASVLARPRLLLAVVALLSAVSAAALVDTDPLGFHMSLDPSEEPMLPAGDPARDVYRDAVLEFGDDDLFVIAMQTPDLFTSRRLEVMREIGESIRQIDGVRRTQSLVDTTDYRYDAAADLVEIDTFIDDIPTGASELAALRERAVANPLFEGSLVSRDGRTGAINVSFRSMTDGEFVEAGIDDRIAAIVAAKADDETHFFLTGRQHIKARAHRIMVDDLLLLIPLAVVVGAVVAWIFAGSLLAGVLPVATSLVATLWVYGLLALLGQPLNLITIILGPTLICVGSVYGVHVLALHREGLAAGLPAPAAAEQCLRQVFTPLAIAGATTVAGFGALAISDTPAIRQLGLFSVLGVTLAVMLSLSALPALLSILPPGLLRGRAGWPAALLDRCLGAMTTLVLRRRGAVLGAWGLAIVVALACIPRIVVDSDYLTFFDPVSDVRRDFAAVSSLLTGAVPLYVTVDGGEEGAFREPANLRAVEALQERIDAVDGVSATTSIVDLLKRANRVFEKDDPSFERIPDTRGEVADVMFLLPKGEARRFVNSNHSRANIVVRTGRSGSAAVLGLERELRRTADAAGLPAPLQAEVTGNAVVVNHGAEGIARNQFSTVAAAALAILLIVSRVFRSVRVALLAMIPNVAPLIVFFGTLGSGVATLSLPTSLISCIALGIAIDDTAHFLVGYRRRRAAGATPEEAAADCMGLLGRPIVVTSLMLVAGFLVLSFSGFATLREFGYLTAWTMVVCLLADLLLLPAVLLRAKA